MSKYGNGYALSAGAVKWLWRDIQRSLKTETTAFSPNKIKGTAQVQKYPRAGRDKRDLCE